MRYESVHEIIFKRNLYVCANNSTIKKIAVNYTQQLVENKAIQICEKAVKYQ